VLHPLGAHADDNLVAGLDLGIRTGFGDDWLRLGAVKIFADGSLVGRTAALHDPYHRSGGAGYLQADADALRDAIIAAHRSGWQVATHAIGDRAVDLALDAYAEALERYPRPDPRQPHRALRRGPAPPGRPGRGARRDRRAAGALRRRTRRRHARRGRSGPARLAVPAAVPAGGRHGAAGQLGRPVVAGAPLLGIDGMVNRRTSSGAPFNPGEAVTAEQALRAWTWGSAYASRQEHVKGSIAPGMLADLVVLSEDPTAVSPERIAGLEVLATITGGEPPLRHRRPGLASASARSALSTGCPAAARPHQAEQARRPRQAADVRGVNTIGAALHGCETRGRGRDLACRGDRGGRGRQRRAGRRGRARPQRPRARAGCPGGGDERPGRGTDFGRTVRP